MKFLMFNTELAMHNCFGKFLKKNICSQKVDYDYEVENLFGIPDYIIFEKTKKNLKYVISIELKLKNWKQGIIQAFRYKNFSNIVFLVIDEKNIKPPLKNIIEFEKYNVGLASFSQNKDLKFYYFPKSDKPHSKFYTSKLKNELINKEKLSFGKRNLNLLEKKKSDILLKKLNKYIVDLK